MRVLHLFVFAVLLCAINADWLRDVDSALKSDEERQKLRETLLAELEQIKPELSVEQYERTYQMILETLSDDAEERQRAMRRVSEEITAPVNSQ